MFLPQVTVLYQEKTSLKTLVSLKQQNCKEVQYHVTPKYFIQISFWLLRITEKETHLFLMFRKHKRIGLNNYHMKSLQTYFCTLCLMTQFKKKMHEFKFLLFLLIFFPGRHTNISANSQVSASRLKRQRLTRGVRISKF